MGREEKLLNDETICSVKLLAHTSTNSKTSSMATSSVAKRETAISRYTPIFFSLMIPSPFPNYKRALFYQCESTKRYKENLNTPHLFIDTMQRQHPHNPKRLAYSTEHRFKWSFKSHQNESHSCMTSKTGTAFSHNITGLKWFFFFFFDHAVDRPPCIKC